VGCFRDWCRPFVGLDVWKKKKGLQGAGPKKKNTPPHPRPLTCRCRNIKSRDWRGKVVFIGKKEEKAVAAFGPEEKWEKV